MRSCDDILELISASLDGELSADEQAALEEHIACCPACSALFDELSALHTAAQQLEEVPAPEGFAGNVMAAIAANPAQETPVSENTDKVIPFAPRRKKSLHWKNWTATAAALAIVVLGAVALSSLKGNFDGNMTKAESADLSIARADDCAAEPQASALNDAVMDQAQYSMAQQESAVAEETPYYDPAEDSYGIVLPSPDSDPTDYVGVLVLEGPLTALADYQGVASSDGTVTYLLDAEEFMAILTGLEEHKEVGYSYTAGPPDAKLGKIVIQSN